MEADLAFEQVKARILGLPEVIAWPEMGRIFEQAATRPRLDWKLPVLACQAVGGPESAGVAGAAAIACMQRAIILVDDILDNDPRGVHCEVGEGASANLALAFQAAAFRLIEGAQVDAGRKAAAMASLATMALATAAGQALDVQNLSGEENYWRVVEAKSTPFFGGALHVGALLGGASPEVAEALRRFGVLTGEVVQIYDDLLDTLQSPASPDWTEGRNSLPILYALTADYPDAARFKALLKEIDRPESLQAAQQILIRCGAVSYCAYHVVRRFEAGRELLASIPLVEPAPMLELLARYVRPLETLLKQRGSTLPVDVGDQ